MALWLEFRAYDDKPPLQQFFDFVFVTPELHNEFDAFKAAEIKPNRSFLPLVALLEYWNVRRPIPSPTVIKYDKHYLSLESSEVDELCQWVCDMREFGLSTEHGRVKGLNTAISIYYMYTCFISIEHRLHEAFMSSDKWSDKKRCRSPSPEIERKKRRPDLGDTKVIVV